MSSPAESPSATADAAPNRSAGRASPVLRPGEDHDAEDLITLVGTCFAEYPGCVLDVDGEIPELRAIATWTARRGGAFWCAEHAGRVVASVGAMPLAGDGDGPAIELVKLYVLPEARGTGLARRLVGAVEDHARAAGAGRIELWTDTRFTTAHRVYERLGYRRTARTRAIADKSDSMEFHYLKALASAGDTTGPPAAGPGRTP